MEKTYKGAVSGLYVLLILFFIVFIGLFVGIGYIAPFPLNYVFFVFITIGLLISISGIRQVYNGFYLKVSEDKSITIVRVAELSTNQDNTMKLVGKYLRNVRLTKDNIVEISGPFKRSLYLKELFVYNVWPKQKKGIGRYSYFFASSSKGVVKITLKNLNVEFHALEGVIVYQYTINDAVIFVSLKEAKKFVEEYR